MINPVQNRPNLTSIKPYIPESKTAIAGTGGFFLGGSLARILTNLARQRSKELQAQHIKKTDDAQARQAAVSNWRLLGSAEQMERENSLNLNFFTFYATVPGARYDAPDGPTPEQEFTREQIQAMEQMGNPPLPPGCGVNIAMGTSPIQFNQQITIVPRDRFPICDKATRQLVGAYLCCQVNADTAEPQWVVVERDGRQIPDIQIIKDASGAFCFQSTREVGSLPPSKYHTITNHATTIRLAAAVIGGITGLFFSQKK